MAINDLNKPLKHGLSGQGSLLRMIQIFIISEVLTDRLVLYFDSPREN